MPHILEAVEACATVGEELAEPREAPGLLWLAGGRSATRPVVEAAKTTAPKATSPASTAIGTSPTRLPMAGESVRQFGQKPETGVKTLPQFRHRIGRRSRAMACLAAFSMRDRF